MVDTERTADLARLYRLFITVPTGLPCLKRSLKDSIAHRGKEVNRVSLGADSGDMDLDPDVDEGERAKNKGKGKARPPANGAAQKLALALKWVQDVLDLRDKFDAVWKSAFNCDRDIESALNEVKNIGRYSGLKARSSHFP